MSIQVEILNEQKDEIAPTMIEMLKQLLQKGAEMEKVEEKEVVVTLVDNEQIKQLNREFRNLDKPTDVLSFPLDEEDSLGDIIISIPRAKEQATEYGHSFERELGFLTIHGFLHLLGYDHHTEEEEKEMFGKQEKILSEYGLSR
ncbi:rRNA maturation RNase YbeY [Ammoniphilus resinae]|uniref:Endoribonuclease YbeY n=1 Tax=Ammoniphilus resinae TaxID=861532 RepID=A0ABS4GKA5_9BACL|nr:rRNA maturation RNase YbeY [Ammoniphilus resinae]MBP1930532.1 putative rRNA maturation factor [Ammoniphilus resinae]